MSMTRKDFNAIAEIIRKYTLVGADLLDLHLMTNELATYFKKANPSFDRGKFIKACGYYQE